ncbi:flagellar biosynthetic protein FliO [Shewanella maritima]|uniref:flagellar biosynthetic protein FliO n=1 Tax=Shewanella maritima TaxID=2520507 RepID=UPI003736007C
MFQFMSTLTATTQVSSADVAEVASTGINTSSELSQISTFANMIGGLIVVLILIFVMAYIVRKLNLTPTQNNTFKTVAVSAIGQREKLMVVELNGQQYFLGVTAQQISLIDKLETPIVVDNTTFAERLKKAKEASNAKVDQS